MKKIFKTIMTTTAALAISLSGFCIVCAEPAAGSATLNYSDESSSFVDENTNSPNVPMYFTYEVVQQVLVEWGAMNFVYSATEGWGNSFSSPAEGTISNNEIKITNLSTMPIRVSYILNINDYTDLDIDDGDESTIENIGFRVTTENTNDPISGDNTILSFGYPEQTLNAAGEEGDSGSVYVTVQSETPTITGTYNQAQIGSITVSIYSNA